MLGQLGVKDLEQAGVAIALIAMIIVVALSLKSLGVTWLATAKERYKNDHDLAVKRLESEEKETTERQKLEREQNEVLKAIGEQLKSNREQADSARQVQQAMTITVDRLVQAVQSLNEYLTGTEQRMNSMMTSRLQWQDSTTILLKSLPETVHEKIQADLNTQLTEVRGIINQAFEQAQSQKALRVTLDSIKDYLKTASTQLEAVQKELVRLNDLPKEKQDGER